MESGICRYSGSGVHKLVVHSIVDNYRVRGEIFTDELPKLEDATKIAARIACRTGVEGRESDLGPVGYALTSLLAAIYQLNYVPNVPEDYEPYEDSAMEFDFF